MKKIFKLLSLILAVILTFSSIPAIYVAPKVSAQTVTESDFFDSESIFTVLNNGTEFSSLSKTGT